MHAICAALLHCCSWPALFYMYSSSIFRGRAAGRRPPAVCARVHEFGTALAKRGVIAYMTPIHQRVLTLQGVDPGPYDSASERRRRRPPAAVRRTFCGAYGAGPGTNFEACCSCAACGETMSRRLNVAWVIASN